MPLSQFETLRKSGIFHPRLKAIFYVSVAQWPVPLTIARYTNTGMLYGMLKNMKQ